MTDTKQRKDKRIFGDQRIFQAVFNDLKMEHELVKLADGTERWVYTYDGVDPYELEDSAFSLTVQLIHQYGDTREAEGRISGMKQARAAVIRRTEIPADAKNPTRDYVVILGEEIASIIDDQVAELKKTKEEKIK